MLDNQKKKCVVIDDLSKRMTGGKSDKTDILATYILRDKKAQKEERDISGREKKGAER